MALGKGGNGPSSPVLAPRPRRRGTGVRLLRRYWWASPLVVGLGIMGLVGMMVEGRDRAVVDVYGENRPAPLATAVAERRHWARGDGAVTVSSEELGGAVSGVETAGVEAVSGGSVVRQSEAGVLALSSRGMEAWRFKPSMQAGDHSVGYVDRITWYREHSSYLQVAADEVFGALRVAMEREPGTWDRSWSADVRDVAGALRDVYGDGREIGWQFSVQRWVCSEDLDVDLHQGVTAGCPTAAEWHQLAQTWLALGQVNETLWKMGVWESRTNWTLRWRRFGRVVWLVWCGVWRGGWTGLS